MPIGKSPEGLPIGVQIIGGYLEDRTTIAFAELIEREFGGFTPPPLWVCRWLLRVKTIEVVQDDSKLWYRRVSRVAERPGEGRLLQPTAAFLPSQAEPLFVPHSGHSPELAGTFRAEKNGHSL
jgi:hypothetical protein